MSKSLANTWANMRAFMFSEQKWLEAEVEVEGLIKLLALPDQATVLDLPCGEGRHSLGLARRGFQVTGVDLTAEFLEEAQRRSYAAGLDLEWLQADMRTFCREDSFDAVINMYTSFGYFHDPKEDSQVLENFYASLKPGGKLLMDLMSREIFARKMKQQSCQIRCDGSILIAEHNFIGNSNWLDNKWTLLDQNENHFHEAKMGLRLYSKDELCYIIMKTGFIKIKLYGDFNGSEYGEEACHLVLVAEKPPMSVNRKS